LVFFKVQFRLLSPFFFLPGTVAQPGFSKSEQEKRRIGFLSGRGCLLKLNTDFARHWAFPLARGYTFGAMSLCLPGPAHTRKLPAQMFIGISGRIGLTLKAAPLLAFSLTILLQTSVLQVRKSSKGAFYDLFQNSRRSRISAAASCAQNSLKPGDGQ
jgi:hypothetical protein